MEVELTVLAEADESSAESLISSNDPDDMANEQTWPTEDELNEAQNGSIGEKIPDAKTGTTPKRVRKPAKKVLDDLAQRNARLPFLLWQRDHRFKDLARREALEAVRERIKDLAIELAGKVFETQKM